MAGTEPLAQRKEKDMGKGKRIVFTILAWIVSHFTLHIAFAAANNNNPPVGLIAIISICIAGAVYSFTREKGKVEERSKSIETDNKKGKSMSDETNDESISTIAKEFIKQKESPNPASFNGHLQTEIAPKKQTGDIAINENELYEQIWREIEENKTDLGLWAKCFAKCEGDENKTKALYVNESVLFLKEKVLAEEAERKGCIKCGCSNFKHDKYFDEYICTDCGFSTSEKQLIADSEIDEAEIKNTNKMSSKDGYSGEGCIK